MKVTNRLCSQLFSYEKRQSLSSELQMHVKLPEGAWGTHGAAVSYMP